MLEEKQAIRNLRIMWFANFFVGASMTMVLPFLSLLIETFGDHSSTYVQHWAGWTFAVTFVTAFIFAPIWGRIGDQYGRKKILIFSGLGLAASLFLMGFVSSVWELFILRFFTGIFTGFIPMSQAYISTQTPKEKAGKVLGTLQTGNITGSLMGPLLGGVLADSIGFAATFQTTSFSIIISVILVLTTKEFKLKAKSDEKKSYSSKEVLSHIIHNPVMITVLLLSTLIQVANFSIQPILSLFVNELHGAANLAFFSGLAFSLTGLGNLLMARKWGSIGDQFGHLKLLVILLFVTGLIYLPGAFITEYWQLLIIRFVLGAAMGGLIPLRVAYIRREAPIAMQGEVLGYNTSLQFLGNMIGPAIGGIISGYFGFSSVFITTSVLLIICGFILLTSIRRQMKAMNPSVRVS
ncbi:MFS transporter [Bacillus tuaregi]|uniref:MFS transporter n=1 Tax=Bacillus tuaregi TaxID=1816695 RepID=UPI0008F813FD|nr:MFS transporter [Bacillus tuaregi]